jgi:hypothetical protein
MGIQANISVAITKANGLSASGWVDPFNIGPFRISGAVGEKASFALTIGKHEQSGSINGMIQGLGLT